MSQKDKFKFISMILQAYHANIIDMKQAEEEIRIIAELPDTEDPRR